VQARISLGGGLGRAGQTAEALKAYTEAIKLDRLAASAYVGRGAARLELGQLDAALSDLNQALRLKPDLADALFYRAQVHSRRGDSLAAQADLDRLRAARGKRP
jgi:tetratricopeptide (TPR) repeat protein